jgi:hypothetical protein
MTSLLAHGIGLTSVLGDSGVHSLHDIWSDGRVEDLIQSPLAAVLSHQGTEGSRVYTFGSGWVAPLAVPSAERMVTVGREAIVRD